MTEKGSYQDKLIKAGVLNKNEFSSDKSPLERAKQKIAEIWNKLSPSAKKQAREALQASSSPSSTQSDSESGYASMTTNNTASPIGESWTFNNERSDKQFYFGDEEEGTTDNKGENSVATFIQEYRNTFIALSNSLKLDGGTTEEKVKAATQKLAAINEESIKRKNQFKKADFEDIDKDMTLTGTGLKVHIGAKAQFKGDTPPNILDSDELVKVPVFSLQVDTQQTTGIASAKELQATIDEISAQEDVHFLSLDTETDTPPSEIKLPQLKETPQELLMELESIFDAYNSGLNPEEKNQALEKALRLTEKIMGFQPNLLKLDHVTAFYPLLDEGKRHYWIVFNNDKSPRPPGVRTGIDLTEEINKREIVN